MWVMSFSYDACVMILLRILSKIITEASYLKLTIKPHKLATWSLGSAVETTEQPWNHNRNIISKTHNQNFIFTIYTERLQQKI